MWTALAIVLLTGTGMPPDTACLKEAVRSWDGTSLPVISYETIDRVCTDQLALIPNATGTTREVRIAYLWRRGLARYHLFRIKDAFLDLAACTELGETDPQLRFAFARAAVGVDRFRQQGIDVAKALTQIRDSAALGHCVLGIAHYAEHDWQQAEEALSKAIAARPNWMEPYAWRGQCRFEVGKWRECAEDMKVVIARPQATTCDGGTCRIILTFALSQLKDERGVDGNLVVLASMYADRDMFPHALWLLRSWQGRHGEALLVAKRHTDALPQSVFAWRNLALSFAQFGKLDAALHAAQTCVRLKSNDALSWGVLARVHALRGEYDKAASGFLQAASLADKNHTSMDFEDGVRMALLLAACPDAGMRDGVGAIKVSQKIPLPASPTPRRLVLLLRAAALAEDGQSTRAVELADQALELLPLTDSERQRICRLRSIFASGKAYRHDWMVPSSQLIRMAPAQIVALDRLPYMRWGTTDRKSGSGPDELATIVAFATLPESDGNAAESK